METQEKTQKTLFDLVEGDMVILVSYSGVVWDIGDVWDTGVTKVTKTQIVTEQQHYYKKNGRMVGGTANSTTIRLPKQGEIVKLAMAREKRSSIAAIREVDWLKCSQETLDAVDAIVTKDEENR